MRKFAFCVWWYLLCYLHKIFTLFIIFISVNDLLAMNLWPLSIYSLQLLFTLFSVKFLVLWVECKCWALMEYIYFQFQYSLWILTYQTGELAVMAL